MNDVLLFDPDPESRAKTSRSFQRFGRAVASCGDCDLECAPNCRLQAVCIRGAFGMPCSNETHTFRCGLLGAFHIAVELARTGSYITVSCHMHDTEEMQLVMRLRELQPDARMYVAGELDLISQHADRLIISMSITPWVYPKAS